MECTREKVLVSNVITKHGEELHFLKQLQQKLHTPGTTIANLANDISNRINALESGDMMVTSNVSERTWRGGRNLGSEPTTILPMASLSSSGDREEKCREYHAVATLESLAWGRHYGGCYPHRRCNCYSYRSPSETISIRSDPSIPPPGLDASLNCFSILERDRALLPSIQQSVTLVKFHISHMAWHHGILHTPTFLEQCELFWGTNTCQHPSWIALYVAVLSVRFSVSYMLLYPLRIGY